ncbi:MAG: tyrosine--tRNA ligase, partial [Bacteroidota bacterium]
MVNNYDWFKDFSLLDFLRDVGKHLTLNYMMTKDSVKSRMETGISFTEFTYQLIQGYDFYHLNKEYDCDMQFGGSDQWGNITTGTELIRRMNEEEKKVYGLVCPLITKADGTKYGKSEKGNIYVDAEMTSPFEFYQFFLKQSDVDIVPLVKIFSLKPIDELKAVLAEHEEKSGARVAQKMLGEEMTIRIHGEEALQNALSASKLLFGKGGIDDLRQLSEALAAELFSGVPQGSISRSNLEAGVNILDFLADTAATSSKGDARRKLTKDRCISINMEKTADPQREISSADLIQDKFILVNIGKRNRHIVYIED